MKQVLVDNTQNQRERSEGSDVEISGITVSVASFFFHPPHADICIHTTSFFTHTHVYARAYARKRACVRGVGKEVRRSTALAAVTFDPRWQRRTGLARQNTTRGTWRHTIRHLVQPEPNNLASLTPGKRQIRITRPLLSRRNKLLEHNLQRLLKSLTPAGRCHAYTLGRFSRSSTPNLGTLWVLHSPTKTLSDMV